MRTEPMLQIKVSIGNASAVVELPAPKTPPEPVTPQQAHCDGYVTGIDAAINWLQRYLNREGQHTANLDVLAMGLCELRIAASERLNAQVLFMNRYYEPDWAEADIERASARVAREQERRDHQGTAHPACPCGDEMSYVKGLEAWVCAVCQDRNSAVSDWSGRSMPEDRTSRAAARRCANRDYYLEKRRLRLLNERREAVVNRPALYARVVDSGPCVYCGESARCADHVRPLVEGGVDDASNLVPACTACNQSKGVRVLTNWDEDRVAFGRTHSAVVAVEGHV